MSNPEMLKSRLKEIDFDLVKKRIQMTEKILAVERTYQPTMCRLIEAKKEIMKELERIKK